MFITNENNEQQTKYPTISDKLIESLLLDFPNELPSSYVDDFELGKLLGQQEVINKLRAEKAYQDEEDADNMS